MCESAGRGSADDAVERLGSRRHCRLVSCPRLASSQGSTGIILAPSSLGTAVTASTYVEASITDWKNACDSAQRSEKQAQGNIRDAVRMGREIGDARQDKPNVVQVNHPGVLRQHASQEEGCPEPCTFTDRGARSVEERRRGFDAALRRRSRFDGAGDWHDRAESMFMRGHYLEQKERRRPSTHCGTDCGRRLWQ